MSRISRFEVVLHDDSRLPSNFRLRANGVLEEFDSATNTYEVVLVGRKEVHIRRAPLGEISVD